MIDITKTPDMLFSKRLTHRKHLLLIQNDLKEHKVSHLNEKCEYLNMSYIVLLYAEWQFCIQDIVNYGYNLWLKKTNPSEEDARKLRQICDHQLENFTNPTTKYINKLFENTLGISKIADNWFYDGCSLRTAKDQLNTICDIRNSIAHSAQCDRELNPEICFKYMEHLYKLSVITRQVIDDYDFATPST